jgi:hypothetical protein
MSAAHLASINAARSVLSMLLPASLRQAFIFTPHVKSAFDDFLSRSDTSAPSFTQLCSEVRHKQKSLVGHVHKKMAEELKQLRPAAELFRVQALSLTGANEWLTAMPYEHDLRIPPHLMKWASATYLQAPLLQQPLDCSRCEQGQMDVWGLHAMRCHIGSKHRHDALNHALSQIFGAAGRMKSIEPVGVFAGVQGAHERPDHCLLADDGQDLFADSSMVFANDRHVRVVVGKRERVKVNKYGENCRRAGAFFSPLVLEARSGGMSKTTANNIKKPARLAGHRMGSDPCFWTGGDCRN